MSSAFLNRAASFAWGNLNREVRRCSRARDLREVLPALQCVVSVGNLQAGGSGKTPFTIWLADELSRRGREPIILLRGYGSDTERSGRSASIAPGEHPSPARFGDESALIRERLPDVWLGVGPDRRASLESIVERRPKFDRPPVVILDDGLQQFRIQRDWDVILVTSDGPDSRVYREREDFGSEASRALWVWTKGERPPFENFSGSRDPARRARVRFIPRILKGDPTQARRWLPVVGIGDPASFFKGLADHLRMALLPPKILRDHAALSSSEWRSVAATLEKGDGIVLTLKDWVKYRDLSFDVPLLVVEPELDWLETETGPLLDWGLGS